MFLGSSPELDGRSGIDRAFEEKIRALESRFDGEMKDLTSNLKSDMSDFWKKKFASLSSEFESIKRQYEGLKSSTQHRMNEVQTNMTSLMEENDKFKNKQNHALEDFKTQQAESLEQYRTQLESNQKTFKENYEKSIREEQNQKIQETGDGDKVNQMIDDIVVVLFVAIIVSIVIGVVMLLMRQIIIAVQNAVRGSKAIHGEKFSLSSYAPTASISKQVRLSSYAPTTSISKQVRLSSYAPTTSISKQDHVNKLLKTVQVDCAKEKTVCILYFSKQSKELCVNLTKTVEPDTQKHTTYYLDNTRDIPNMPRSKVIIIYVEKNERNVILECPYQDIGDLRWLTVVAARKMGATVVVVYMHHEESRNLGKEELYCPTLYSVRIHNVLSELEKEGAVLSVFDSFSDFQQKHLKDLFLKSIV